jgi:hypothetical protein
MDPKPHAAPPSRGWLARGFSQLELLTTVTLTGIMFAGAVHHWMPQAGKSTAGYQALRLADDLRHTRLLAMGWGKTLNFNASASSWRVSCAVASSCTQVSAPASTCPDSAPAVVDPGHHGPFCVPLENGVTLSGPSSIGFDLLGRPQYAGAITYQLSANGATIATVSVAADTGFVSTSVQQ